MIQILAVLTALTFVGRQTEIIVPHSQLARLHKSDTLCVVQRDTTFFAVVDDVTDSSVVMTGLEEK